MIENVEKYSDTKLIGDDEKMAELKRSVFFKRDFRLENEAGEFGAYEIISKKKKTLDDKAHHVGVCILQYSKLLFLR